MKSFYLALVLFLVSFSLVAHAATNAFDPALLAYNLKTTVDAYDKAGRKNPKWDADAKNCLLLFARIRSWTNDTPLELVQELQTNVSHVVAKGCDDPLIRYLYLRFGDASKAAPNPVAFSKLSEDLQKSDYPDIRKFYAIMRERSTWVDSGKQPAETQGLLTKAATHLAKALNDPAMPLAEADKGCQFLMTEAYAPETVQWNCYQALEPGLTNRWNGSSMALLMKGRAYIAFAWLARGHKYADSVSEANWNLVAERAKVAEDALEAAWRLDPHDVRICQQMERLEFVQTEGRGRLDLWFQRGMKLDPGNYDLCDVKLDYLRPRWGGSEEEMIAFGRYCTRNTNWTGQVRLMLAYAHRAVSQEIQDDSERAMYWTHTNVWPDVKFTYDQFFKLYPEEVGYRHNYALSAARCGQWDEFLHQVSLFPSTNVAYFGGEERFHLMLKEANDHVKKP